MMNVRVPFRPGQALILMCGLLLICAGTAGSQSSDEAPETGYIVERCSGPEHREFDFWLGTWEVRNANGDLLGHNEIRRVAGGCGLLESWRGTAGGQGMSINTYDGDREKWTQRWVGTGATLWLEGIVEGGRMVLAGPAPRSTPDGEVLDRVT